MAKKRVDKGVPGMDFLVCRNPRAAQRYDIDERLEAGIDLGRQGVFPAEMGRHGQQVIGGMDTQAPHQCGLAGTLAGGDQSAPPFAGGQSGRQDAGHRTDGPGEARAQAFQVGDDLLRRDVDSRSRPVRSAREAIGSTRCLKLPACSCCAGS
mgnify:CR=1 FL=1